MPSAVVSPSPFSLRSSIALPKGTFCGDKLRIQGPPQIIVNKSEAQIRNELNVFLPNINLEDLVDLTSTMAELHIIQGHPKEASQEVSDLLSALKTKFKLDEVDIPDFVYLDLVYSNSCEFWNSKPAQQNDYKAKIAVAYGLANLSEAAGEFQPLRESTGIFSTAKGMEKVIVKGLCSSRQ